MRILPVNNYNYQSKTQNNQQQNVNFGMFKGSADDVKKLCDLAEFTKLGAKLKDFSVSRKFEQQELKEFQTLVERAEKENIVMSPIEDRNVEIILLSDQEGTKHRFRGNDGIISNGDFIKLFAAIVDRAKPVTEPVQYWLRQIAGLKEYLSNPTAFEVKAFETIESPAIVESRQKREYSASIQELKSTLYAASVAK
jgi:hypothetical protein